MVNSLLHLIRYAALSGVVGACFVGGGCSSPAYDDIDPSGGPNTGEEYEMTFASGIVPGEEAGATRAEYERAEHAYRWNEGDEIGVYIADADNKLLHRNLRFSQAEGTLAADRRSVSFSGTIPGGPPPAGCTYYAVYPYDPATPEYAWTEDRNLMITAEPRQEYVAGGVKQLPFVAKYTDDGSGAPAFTFRNPLAIVKLTIRANSSLVSTPIREVRFGTSSDRERIGGELTVKMSGSTPSVPEAGTSAYAGVRFAEPLVLNAGQSIDVYIKCRSFAIIGGTTTFNVEVVSDRVTLVKKSKGTTLVSNFLPNKVTVLSTPVEIGGPADFTAQRGVISDQTQPSTTLAPLLAGLPGARPGGTELNPWVIESGADLLGVTDFLERLPLDRRQVKLMTDIQIISSSWTPVDLPGYTTFDGNRKKIFGTIRQPAEDAIDFGIFVGNPFFTLKNLTVSTAFEGIQGCRYLGGIVGYMDKGTIENCTFDGTIRNSNTDKWPDIIGGLVGRATFGEGGGRIVNCNMTGTIEFDHPANYIPPIGGIAGEVSMYLGESNALYLDGTVVGGELVEKNTGGTQPGIFFGQAIQSIDVEGADGDNKGTIYARGFKFEMKIDTEISLFGNPFINVGLYKAAIIDD